MKKGIKVTLRFLLFFIAWCILVSLFIYEPGFTKQNPALLRLWLEFIHLSLTVLISLVFVYIVEKKSNKDFAITKFTERYCNRKYNRFILDSFCDSNR